MFGPGATREEREVELSRMISNEGVGGVKDGGVVMIVAGFKNPLPIPRRVGLYFFKESFCFGYRAFKRFDIL